MTKERPIRYLPYWTGRDKNNHVIVVGQKFSGPWTKSIVTFLFLTEDLQRLARRLAEIPRSSHSSMHTTVPFHQEVIDIDMHPVKLDTEGPGLSDDFPT